MRAFKAARRSAERRPIPFLYSWDEVVVERDPDTNEAVGESVRERREEFVCKGEVSTLLLSELAHNSDIDIADPAAMALIRNFFSQAFGVRYESVVGEDGEVQRNPHGEPIEIPLQDDAFFAYRKFFNLHTKHGDDELLMEILGGLVEDFVARPTKPASTSQPGPSAGGEVSKVVSLSRGTVEIVPGETLEQNAEDSAATS